MFGKRPIVSSTRGMVAAAHPHAAQAGARVLRDGGNAFDAAVAAAATLNVAEPFMSGLAGLGMAVAWVADEQRVRALDFMTAVPLEFDPGVSDKDHIFQGAQASAPPGSLAGWARLAADHGTRPLGDLLQPAIELARDGLPVTDGLAAMTADWADLRAGNKEWLRVYTGGSGSAEVGSVLRQPDLARTLESVARDGIGVLYGPGGALGRAMLSHLREHGGCLGEADLERVAPRWTEPLSVRYRDLTVHSMPPPAEAMQFLLTLAVLDHFDVAAYRNLSADYFDTLFRAIRVSAETRIRHNHCEPAAAQSLLSGEPVEALVARVKDGAPLSGRTQQWRAITDPVLRLRREHTTSLSVADAFGNMVCITQSLGSIYGSGVVVPGTGVCMNNFLNWGDLEPDSPNFLRPGGPLAMCLAPSISTRAGEPVLALGTPGSYGILQTQVQALVQHVDFGLDLQAAVEAPRARLFDGTFAMLESRVDAAVVDCLRARGHEVELTDPWTLKVGGIHAVRRAPETGVLTGAADPRRDGYAAPA